MGFDRAKLDFVKSQTSIVDLYQHLFPTFPVSKIGKDYVGTCPFCSKEKHFYLYQNEGLAKCPVFICYSCSKRGDSINLVEKGKELKAGQAIMWFLYQWSGLTRDDFLREETGNEFNDKTYHAALDTKESIQYQIWQKKEEEKIKSEDFDFKKEIFKLLEDHIKSESEFLEELRKFVDEKIGGEVVLKIKGWEVKRVQTKSGGNVYYYWRGFKKNHQPLHIGNALEIEDVTKKIDERMKELRKEVGKKK